MQRFLAGLLAFAFPAICHAAEPGATRFSLPIDCQYGRNCFIQNYVDTAPTSDYRDYHCGKLSYDKHTGTDFRLVNLRAMRDGVAVLAAADGMVRNTRDGMRDISVREVGKAAIRDRECGNGVVISHAPGLESQYCHLRLGSITVKKGQIVKAGDKIGLVGLSGDTEFPHVHFAIRKNEEVLDPFTGLPAPPTSQTSLLDFDGCKYDSTLEAGSLWSEKTKQQLQYIPTALLGAGFSGVAPDAKAAQEGEYNTPSLPNGSKIMAFWVELIGMQPGDRLTLELTSPAGETLAKQEKEIPESKAQLFAFIGKRYNSGKIAPGAYQGKVTLWRKSGSDTTPAIDETRTMTIH